MKVRIRAVAAVALAITMSLAGFLWVVSSYTEMLASLVPRETEARWTEALWRHVDGAMTSEMAAMAERLEQTVNRLLEHDPTFPYTIEVAVLDQEIANAVGLPGGKLLVTAGLVELVPDENAMAYMLAHELGHLRYRDHLEILGRDLTLVLLMDAFGVSMATISRHLETSGLLTARPFSDFQEERADRYALGRLAALYGHTAGPAPFLVTLSRKGWPQDHLIMSANQARRRRSRLLNMARKEMWEVQGELTALERP